MRGTDSGSMWSTTSVGLVLIRSLGADLRGTSWEVLIEEAVTSRSVKFWILRKVKPLKLSVKILCGALGCSRWNFSMNFLDPSRCDSGSQVLCSVDHPSHLTR